MTFEVDDDGGVHPDFYNAFMAIMFDIPTPGSHKFKMHTRRYLADLEHAHSFANVFSIEFITCKGCAYD